MYRDPLAGPIAQVVFALNIQFYVHWLCARNMDRAFWRNRNIGK